MFTLLVIVIGFTHGAGNTPAVVSATPQTMGNYKSSSECSAAATAAIVTNNQEGWAIRALCIPVGTGP